MTQNLMSKKFVLLLSQQKIWQVAIEVGDFYLKIVEQTNMS